MAANKVTAVHNAGYIPSDHFEPSCGQQAARFLFSRYLAQR
jgi:hypothetical protein